MYKCVGIGVGVGVFIYHCISLHIVAFAAFVVFVTIVLAVWSDRCLCNREIKREIVVIKSGPRDDSASRITPYNGGGSSVAGRS